MKKTPCVGDDVKRRKPRPVEEHSAETATATRRAPHPAISPRDWAEAQEVAHIPPAVPNADGRSHVRPTKNECIRSPKDTRYVLKAPFFIMA